MCSNFSLSSNSVASSMGGTLQEPRSSMGGQVSHLGLPERLGPSQPAHAARTALLYQRIERPHPLRVHGHIQCDPFQKYVS